MERHPLAQVSLELASCTPIELFALQSLHEERIRRSQEAIEDIAAEQLRRAE